MSKVSHFTSIMVNGKLDSVSGSKPKLLTRSAVIILLNRLNAHRAEGKTAYLCEVKGITEAQLLDISADKNP